MSDDQIRTYWGMLATYRENARMLLQQAALRGGEVQAPLVTRHDLAEARGQIARYKAVLRGLGAPVDDLPEDEAPPAPALPSADPARDAAARAFEERYARLLCDRLDRLEIFGIPAMDAVTKRQRLSVAYVTLQAERPGPRRGPHEPPAPYELARRLDDWRWGEEPRRDHVGDVDQILGPIRRALITGPAGAGKTTLVRWLAVNTAADSLPEAMRGWRGCVPFYLRLRTLQQADSAPLPFPAPHELPELDLRETLLKDKVPPGWAEGLLDQGRALLLIDGVDELPEQRRGELLEWLRQTALLYPRVRVLITSRPLRVNEQPWQEWEDWLADGEFVRVRLQDMHMGTIDAFIDHWHAALAERSASDEEREEVRQHAGPLKALLRQRPPLFALATNPLLCAMICALHMERSGSLPAGRVELYRQCVEMLLERDSGRKIAPDPALPPLDVRQKRRLIQDFAARLSREGSLGVERAAADQAFDYWLQSMSLPRPAAGRGVTRLFIERARLLHEPLPGQVEFVHRTFQEFLAADALVQAGEIATLVRHATDETWRETIVLAAGLANHKQANQLLRGVLRQVPAPLDESVEEPNQRQKKQINKRVRLLTLALACLETCVQLDAELRASIMEQARPLFPPRNEEEARLLAAAGPVAVEFLRCQPDYDREVVNSCIQTLAMIGGDAAMDVLLDFALHADAVDALCDAWDYFDRDVYAQSILGKMQQLRLKKIPSAVELIKLDHITTLMLSGFQNLNVLRSLTNLTGLSVSNVQNVDLEPLSGLPQLADLALRNIQQIELTPIKHLPFLADIELRDIKQVDLKPLAGLSSLNEITLSGIEKMDLFDLINTPNITRLKLHELKFVDSNIFKYIKDINHLTLWNIEHIDMDNIVELRNLSHLTLWGLGRLDISMIMELRNLSNLNLWDIDVIDLMILTHMPSLKSISLWGNKNIDIQLILKMTQITSLKIILNKYHNVTMLRYLPFLTSLDLSDSELTSLEPLASLPQLTKLEIARCKGVDLTQLPKCLNLQQLGLSGRQLLLNLSPLGKIPGLRLRIWSHNAQLIRAKLQEHGLRIREMTKKGYSYLVQLE